MTLPNGLCLCNGGTHTGIITIKKSVISVGHMTEKMSRCQLDVKDLRTDSTRPY